VSTQAYLTTLENRYRDGSRVALQRYFYKKTLIRNGKKTVVKASKVRSGLLNRHDLLTDTPKIGFFTISDGCNEVFS
jgi:hypothetical protein